MYGNDFVLVMITLCILLGVSWFLILYGKLQGTLFPIHMIVTTLGSIFVLVMVVVYLFYILCPIYGATA